MKSIKKIVLVTVTLAIASYVHAFPFFSSSASKHKIICVKGKLTQAQDSALRCFAHFDRETSDGYHCYIRFDLNKNINLVVDRQNGDIPEMDFGEKAVATYETKTANGVIFPQALVFDNAGTEKGQIDVTTLVKRRVTMKDLGKAIGATPVVYEAKGNTQATDKIVNKVKGKLGKPFANCVPPAPNAPH